MVKTAGQKQGMDIGLQSRENQPESMLEMLMRFTPASIALAALLTTVSSVGLTQRPDAQIAPLSLEWMRAGEVASKAGNLSGAVDAYESALAVDPRNRAAYVELADVARAQQLPGKAIRLYREALLLEPADVRALVGQGEAMVAKGAVAKAKENLAIAQKVCGSDCAPVGKLSAAIAKGAPPPTILSAKDVVPTPAVPQTEKP